MRRRGCITAVVALLVFSPGTAAGHAPRASDSESAPKRPPKLHLSCPADCFEDYLRQELSYFDFVRDPHLADFAVLIVRQNAGSGGERFTVTLVRNTPGPELAPPSARDFSTRPGTPAHAARGQLAQLILSQLQRELTGTPDEAAFVLSLPRRDGDALSSLDDPWNYWVLAPELRGEGDGASEYRSIELTGALTARRVTDDLKLLARGSYSRRFVGFRLEDGSEVSAEPYSWYGRAVAAWSLGERWALGAIAVARIDEYENLAGHGHGGPLIEFNVFPYSENARQQLRIAYQAGVWQNAYFEENRAGLVSEFRPYNALSLIADVNQRWGSVQWAVQVNSFIDEPDLYRAATSLTLSLRLFEGMSFALEGNAALVRDQISLRNRPITDTELLLWTAEQPTDYLFVASYALVYTFGSVHNTIVNPRFARVDLEED